MGGGTKSLKGKRERGTLMNNVNQVSDQVYAIDNIFDCHLFVHIALE